MPKLKLGPIAVTVSPGEGGDYLDAVAELGRLGYSTIWLSGGPLRRLDQIGAVLDATGDSGVLVASGIIPVVRFDRAAVAATWAELEAKQPGRFIVGLGGAHGPRPLHTLGNYLDHLDTVPPNVPATTRMLAALGPRMLELARDRAAGALPLLMTPDYTAQARNLLGQHATLVVEHHVVLETDPMRARQAAREVIGFLSGVTGYAKHLRRLGFAEEDVAQLSDRLVDALVVWGDLDTIAGRVAEHLEAGADQIALVALPTDGSTPVSTARWRQLAEALIPGRRLG
jgi:probable F420-dependent oxidoreductase